MTDDDIEAITGGLAPVLKELFSKRDAEIKSLSQIVLELRSEVDEIRRDMADVKPRLKTVEDRPLGALDRGVWKAGVTYQRDEGVSWGGSFWIAQQSTTAKPGQSGVESRAWRLGVKRGADGKDLR